MNASWTNGEAHHKMFRCKTYHKCVFNMACEGSKSVIACLSHSGLF